MTGNSAAPASGRALFGFDFTIETTGLPWDAIGLTGVGTILGESRTFELTAFDINGSELGSVTRVFAPTDSSFAAYNAAAVFLGVASTTPIHSILLTSDMANDAWDNLRFSVIPEPSALLLLASALAGLAPGAPTDVDGLSTGGSGDQYRHGRYCHPLARGVSAALPVSEP